MNERCVAVLGWRDEPTDAVEEYCHYLSGGLSAHGVQLELTRVKWPELGWRKALQDLREYARGRRDSWFLLQYTSLGWSRRGFPLRVLKVIRALKKEGGRCAVVFHDPGPYPGNRPVDKFRRFVQLYTMRKAMRMADHTILTVAPARISWLPKGLKKLSFIPVGANLPCPEEAWQLEKKDKGRKPTIAIFSISSGAVGEEEVSRIARALRYASAEIGPVQLRVLGRNSEIGGKQLQEKLVGTPVEVTIHGLLSAKEIVQKLGSSDILLFARGPLSTRRGSAIAGIACGLPVIGCRGWETESPITEAGVVLLAEDSSEEYGPALVRVLIDEDFRASLRERSRRAQQQYFSWAVIAAEYATVLQKTGED